jgi:hypothetical protein
VKLAADKNMLAAITMMINRSSSRIPHLYGLATGHVDMAKGALHRDAVSLATARSSLACAIAPHASKRVVAQ